MYMKKIVTDKEFVEWAESMKPCRHCSRMFRGPVCPCELRGELKSSKIRLSSGSMPTKEDPKPQDTKTPEPKPSDQNQDPFKFTWRPQDLEKH